jgi:hypothetical protein
MRKSILNKLKRSVAMIREPIRTMQYLKVKDPQYYEPGSTEHLIAMEKQFGGYRENVVRRVVSSLDPRTTKEVETGGMRGGDRMFHHGYAEAYSKALAPFLLRRDAVLTVVEIGILHGSGLAMWSTLFPNADIIGLDIDLEYTTTNLPFLRARGAFATEDPELHRFDQFKDDENTISKILSGRKIDICIDDGYHSPTTVMNTAEAIAPHLSNEFVYVVEDLDSASELLAPRFSHWTIVQEGELAIATRG